MCLQRHGFAQRPMGTFGFAGGGRRGCCRAGVKIGQIPLIGRAAWVDHDHCVKIFSSHCGVISTAMPAWTSGLASHRPWPGASDQRRLRDGRGGSGLEMARSGVACRLVDQSVRRAVDLVDDVAKNRLRSLTTWARVGCPARLGGTRRRRRRGDLRRLAWSFARRRRAIATAEGRARVRARPSR